MRRDFKADLTQKTMKDLIVSLDDLLKTPEIWRP